MELSTHRCRFDSDHSHSWGGICCFFLIASRPDSVTKEVDVTQELVMAFVPTLKILCPNISKVTCFKLGVSSYTVVIERLDGTHFEVFIDESVDSKSVVINRIKRECERKCSQRFIW